MRNFPSGLARATLVAARSGLPCTSVLRAHPLDLVAVAGAVPGDGGAASIDAVVDGGLGEGDEEPPNQPANGLYHPPPDWFEEADGSGEVRFSDAEAVRVARPAFGTAGAIGSLPRASPAS